VLFSLPIPLGFTLAQVLVAQPYSPISSLTDNRNIKQLLHSIKVPDSGQWVPHLSAQTRVSFTI
jgi:hypothetical protein